MQKMYLSEEAAFEYGDEAASADHSLDSLPKFETCPNLFPSSPVGQLNAIGCHHRVSRKDHAKPSNSNREMLDC